MSQTTTTILHERELAFHDGWADSTSVDSINALACFDAPTAVENRFILSIPGDLRGKTVLDVGAGLGESSVCLAVRGALVTALDLSPGMVATATALASRHGVAIRCEVAAAEELGFPDNEFDVVYIANTIHHVQDRAKLFFEIRRVLKPGGLFVSIDPLAYNPVINVYRHLAAGVRTEDEAPLRIRDVRLAKQYFADLQHREFWLSSLVLFVKYFLVDRIHPGRDRYWKRILSETEETLGWWKPLRMLDVWLTRMPGLKWLSWNIVMWGRKK